MTSPFAKTITASAATMRRIAGEQAVYLRGTAECPITVVPGVTRFESHQADGMVTQIRVADFLLAAADLVLTNTPVEPADGDRIRITQGGWVNTYEVLPPSGGSDQSWHYRDPAKTEIRVHTKLVLREPAP